MIVQKLILVPILDLVYYLYPGTYSNLVFFIIGKKGIFLCVEFVYSWKDNKYSSLHLFTFATPVIYKLPLSQDSST